MSIPVPDFFVLHDDDARLAQVEWMREHMGVDHELLAHVLGGSAEHIDRWARRRGALSPRQASALDSLWGLVRHLMSLNAFDTIRARAMFDVAVDRSVSPLAPPWSGTTLRDFLRDSAAAGIEEALRWLCAVRHGELHRRAPATSIG